jgi:hypothetical protein
MSTEGHIHRPRSSMVPMASPVGGQTGEALEFKVARESP